ncbi:MAG: DEAD/DEAH box helicase, partial [Nitrososphaerales archaeon]
MSLLSYGNFYVELPLIKRDTVEYRKYQLDIAEVAHRKNTLVVLPTALGKTVVAVLAACQALNAQEGSRILMMAPTRPLVLQHWSSFLKITEFKEKDVLWLTGTIPRGDREAIWSGDAKILVATPQVVANDLSSHTLKLDNFAMIIFDECHRTTENYAYAKISEAYRNQRENALILGMTASPGADEERIRNVCNSLFIQKVECRTEEDDDVKPYLNEVALKWKEVDLPQEYENILFTLRAMIGDRISWLREKRFLHHDNPSKTELLELGNFLRRQLNFNSGRNKGPLYSAIIHQASLLILLHGAELVGSQGIEPAKGFLDRLDSNADQRRSRTSIVKDPRYPRLRELINMEGIPIHPKLEILKDLIKDQLDKDPSSKILIFSQYRDT